jgi:hypothetical protein
MLQRVVPCTALLVAPRPNVDNMAKGPDLRDVTDALWAKICLPHFNTDVHLESKMIIAFLAMVDVFAVSGVISGLVNRIQPEDGNFTLFTACAISGNWNDG